MMNAVICSEHIATYRREYWVCGVSDFWRWHSQCVYYPLETLMKTLQAQHLFTESPYYWVFVLYEDGIEVPLAMLL